MIVDVQGIQLERVLEYCKKRWPPDKYEVVFQFDHSTVCQIIEPLTKSYSLLRTFIYECIAQIHTRYAEDALRLSEMRSRPASKNTRNGMKVKIGDDVILSDFKVGDTLHYNVNVSLEKLDSDGNIMTKLESKDEKITEDGVEVVRTTQVCSPIFETVNLKAGLITSDADAITEEAKKRR